MNIISAILFITGTIILILSLSVKMGNFLDIRTIFSEHFNVFKGNPLQFISIFIVPILFSVGIVKIRCVDREILNNLNIEAQSPAISRPKRSRCRSSQEVNDSPTPFSALNYCLPALPMASMSLSYPNMAAYATMKPSTTAAATIYHTTAIALIWQ